MNIRKLTGKLNKSNTVKSAVHSGLLTISQVNNDAYLKSGYYLDNPVFLVTAQILISEPKIIRGVDISEYAFDAIVEHGIMILFSCGDYIILKPLDEKRFLTCGDKRSIPFGITNFDGFKYGDPILVVEGLRDCLNAQTIYPYTIATQTAGISSVTLLILKTLTNKLILGFDADEPGRRACFRQLRDPSFSYKVLEYPEGVKDMGTISEYLIKDEFKYQYLVSYFKVQLEVLTI